MTIIKFKILRAQNYTGKVTDVFCLKLNVNVHKHKKLKRTKSDPRYQD
jgi:hypothetical protein